MPLIVSITRKLWNLPKLRQASPSSCSFVTMKTEYLLGTGLDLKAKTWNARGYAMLRQHCVESGQTPFVALSSLSDSTISLPHSTELVNRFHMLLTELEALKPLAGNAPLDRLFPDENNWSQAVREAALSKLSHDTSSVSAQKSVVCAGFSRTYRN